MENNEELISLLRAEIDRLNGRVEELTAQKASGQLNAVTDSDSLFQLLKTVSDNTPDFIWVKDSEKRYLYTNKSFCDKLLKATDPLEPVGKTDIFFAERERAIFPERKDWHTFGELCQDSDDVVLRSRKVGRFEEYGRVRGEMLYLDVIKTPFFAPDGTLLGTIGTARDVTKQRIIEQELHEYKSNIERAESAALIMKAFIAPDGRFLKATDGACSYLGLDSQKVFTHSILEILHRDSKGFFRECLRKIEEREQDTAEGPVSFSTEEGATLHAMMYVSAVYALDPKPAYYLLYLRDTTNEITNARLILGQQQSYYSLFQSLATGVIILNSENVILETNVAACEMFGLNRDSFSGISVSDLFADIKDVFIANAISGEKYEVQLKRADSTLFFAEVYIRPEEGFDRKLFICNDISERKLQEQKILEGFELYRTLFRVSTNGILLIDKDGIILDANDANLMLLGYDYSDMVGQHVSLIVPETMHASIPSNIERILAGEVLNHKVTTIRKDGEKITVLLTESKIITPSGDECILSISMDLSETEKANLSLQQSEERYRAFINNASEGIYRLDVSPPIPTWLPAIEQNNLLYERAYIAEANDAVARMYGFTAGRELIGKSYLEMHGGSHNPENIRTNLEFINSGYQTRDALTKERDRNGNTKYFSNNVIGTIKDNQLVAIWGTQADITPIKLASSELEKSEKRFRTVFNNAALGVILLSPTYKIFEWNDAAEQLFKLSEEQLTDRFYPDLIHPQERIVLKDIFSRVAEKGDEFKPVQFDIRIISGNDLKYTRQYVAFINSESGTPDYAVILIDDITEQITAARDVKRLQDLVQGSAKASSALLTEPELSVGVYKALAILGEAAAADRAYVFENDLSEDGNPRMSQKYEWCNKGIVPQIDNGSLQNLSYKQAGYARWYSELSAGKSISGTVVSFPLCEQEMLFDEGIKSLVVVPIFIKGNFRGFVGFDDCTMGRTWLPDEVNSLELVAASLGGAIYRNENNRELLNAKEIAEASAKVQSAIFINLNHELRTPMNAILGFSEALYSEAQSDEQKKWAHEVLTSAKRLMHTLTELIEFAQFETGAMNVQLRSVQLSLPVKNAVLNHNETALYKGLSLNLQSDFNFFVKAEPVLLQRLIETLLSNAVKFTVKGSVTLWAGRVTINGLAYIKIDVTDTGVGIKPEDIQRIFIPFRQVSEGMGRQFEGSGLGLSLARKIVSLFNGQITVSSEPGKGTIFSLTLPEITDNSLQPESITRRKDGKRLDILFVEDNEHNVNLFSRYLSPSHNVVFATDGELALTRSMEVKYDLIMMDIGLPGELDGVAVFNRIRNAEGPNRLTPVVAVTGYSTATERKKLLDIGFNDHLPKPVNIEELNRILGTDYTGQ